MATDHENTEAEGKADQTWTGTYFVQKWACWCDLPEDQRSSLEIYLEPGSTESSDWAKAFEPHWRASLLPLVMQGVFLCISVTVVASIDQGTAVGQDLVFRSMERALQIWPWVWLVIAAVSFTAVQSNRLLMDQVRNFRLRRAEEDSTIDQATRDEINRRGRIRLYQELRKRSLVSAPRVMVLGSVALHSVVWRVCENLYVTIGAVGIPMLFALQWFDDKFICQATVASIVTVSGMLGAIMLWRLTIHPINSESHRWDKFIIRLLATIAVAYLLSWNTIVLLFGASFVFLPLIRDWLIPSMLSFIAFGLARQFNTILENRNYEIAPWLEYLFNYADVLPIATVGFILLVAVGRWLALFREQVDHTGQVIFYGSFGFSMFVLGSPIALWINRLQEWLFDGFRAQLLKMSVPDMLALLTIAASVPTVLALATVYLYRLLAPEPMRGESETKDEPPTETLGRQNT